MQKQLNWRWPIVAVAFVLSLSALVAAQRVVVERRQQPLLTQLEQMPGVERAWLESEGGRRGLWVRVGPTDDLPGLVTALERLALSGRVGSVDELVLVDARTPALVRAHHALSLVLQEGSASGAFTEMAARVEQQARELGLQASRVWVDSRRVYALLQGDGGHLVDVIPRPSVSEGLAPGLPVRVAVDAPYRSAAAGGSPEGGGERL